VRGDTLQSCCVRKDFGRKPVRRQPWNLENGWFGPDGAERRQALRPSDVAL
jgi:hypothetical protein